MKTSIVISVSQGQFNTMWANRHR